jgi:hypothetical protein
LAEQIQEVKKLFDKTVKKKTEQFSRESDYYQAEFKRVKSKNEQIEQTLSQIEKKEKQESAKTGKIFSEKEMERSGGTIELDKKSEAGSLINRSNDDEWHRSMEEKYKSKMEVMRKDLKVKQTRIN